MDKLYIVNDIKKYFDYLINEYPNSPLREKIKLIKFIMFEENGLNDFEKILKKLNN